MRCRTLFEDDSLFDANDLGLQDERFFDVVCNGEDGNSAVEGVLLHERKQNVAEGAVDAGERLVKKYEVRVGDGEAAGEVDALTLSAGKVAG